MKIAIVSNQYPSTASASSAFVHTRAKAYQARGHAIGVWAEEQTGLPLRAELDGIGVIRLPAESTISGIRSFAPDVLAVHSPFKWSIQVALSIGCPTVAWVHGWESLPGWPYHYYTGCGEQVVESLADFFKLARLRRFLQSCSAVVYVSRWMQAASHRFTAYKPARSFVIPNPVDTDLFAPAVGLDSTPRRRGLSLRGLGQNTRGLDIAIPAYARMEITDLTVIGTGRLASRFESLIQRTQSSTRLIQEYYRHEDLPALYGAYGYFVAPSRTESHGISMCEAMACGLPVVASRVGGIPEFVEDGVQGFLVPPGKVGPLREAVKRMVALPNSEYRKLSENAREKVLRTCAFPRVIDEELSVLKQAASTGKRAGGQVSSPNRGRTGSPEAAG